jgi:GTPase SAR1 family protein
MFSFEEGLPIAIVRGGKSDSTIIYLDKDGKESKSMVDMKELSLKDDGKFEQLCNTQNHEICFVAGPSGSGKSTYIANYIRNYQKIYPKKDVFILSALTADKPLDDLGVKRIDLNDEELLDHPLNVEDFRGSLLIFDDYDTVGEKKIQEQVNDLLDQCIQIGRIKSSEGLTVAESRSGDIDVLIAKHQLYDNKKTKLILVEATSVTFFPSSGSTYQIESFLKRYAGLKPDAIDKIFNLDGRWVTLFRRYPQLIMSEKQMYLLGKRTVKLKKTK